LDKFQLEATGADQINVTMIRKLDVDSKLSTDRQNGKTLAEELEKVA
jgi:hypothetical protein